MKRPARNRVRPAVEGLEARVVLTLSPVAAGSGVPFSAIVELEMTYPDGQEFVGSGAMIDSYHVLTAGHVVYSYQHGGWATSITVVPELHGTSEPFGSAQSTNLRTFTTWTNYDRAHPGETSPDALDIGLITLNKTIGLQTGWLSYGYNNDAAFGFGTVFNTAGYPAVNGYDGLSMQASSGWIDGLSSGGNGILFHDPSITVYGGQSGSPVWSPSNGVVYGVAVADSFAIRITPSIYNQIQTWMSSDPPPSYPPPTILGGSYSIAMGSALTVTPAQLLAGSHDPQGLSLSLVNVTNPAHGALTRNSWDGSYTYTPNASFFGVDAFTIQATDGLQYSNIATITIKIPAPTPTPPPNSTLLVVFDSGDFYKYDAAGGSLFAGGVRSASAARTPRGDLVYLVVFMNNDLYQYDATGVHYLMGGVKSTSIAYAPSGAPSCLVVLTNGDLYQNDSTTVHYLMGGVHSASIAYAPSGAPTCLVVLTNGDLYQNDSTTVRKLAGGVLSAQAAYTSSGRLAYEVVFQGGSLFQYDDAGSHYVLGGAASAVLANAYFPPPSSAARVRSAPRTSAPAPASASATPVTDPVAVVADVVERKPAVAAPGRWARAATSGRRWGMAGSARKSSWLSSTIKA